MIRQNKVGLEQILPTKQRSLLRNGTMLEVIGQGDENIGHFFTHLFFENVWNRAVRIHIAKEVDLKTTFISLPCILSNVIGCDHVFADLSGSCGLDSFATLARVHQNIKAILIGAAIETSDDASV